MSSEDDMCHANPSEGGYTSHAPDGATSPGHPGDAKKSMGQIACEAYLRAEGIALDDPYLCWASVEEDGRTFWQAAANAILEEAAKIADECARQAWDSVDQSAALHIAEDIRALKASPQCEDEA